jgi:hypothetical protein
MSGAPKQVFARLTDPTTSWDAAASIDNAVTLSQLQSVILSTLALCKPLTDEQLHEEVENAFGRRFSPSTVRSRRSELQKAGLVVAVDKLGKTIGGRACQRFTKA